MENRKSNRIEIAQPPKLAGASSSKLKNNEATETTQTADVAEQGAHVAPQKRPPKKGATRKKSAPKGQKTVKGAKANAATAERRATAPRQLSLILSGP
jgi:hypothetical protein